MIRKTLEEFKSNLKEKFGDEYTVLDEKYVNNKTPILLKHNKCGNSFKVRPDMILNNYKHGCPFCCKNKLKTNEQFLKEVSDLFGDEYTVLDKYINADTLINVKHNKCGKIRKVLPHRLLKGDKCIYCYGSPKRTIDSIKKELIDKDIPLEFVDTEYNGNKTQVSFKCKKCGKTFKARLNDIISDRRKQCPHCSKRRISKAELIIKNILEKKNINFIYQKIFTDLVSENKRKMKLRFDFYIKFSNGKEMLLEYDGSQHFYSSGIFTEEDITKTHNNDILKNSYATKNNIPLMRITFKDYNNLRKIINRLLSSTIIPDEFKVVDSSGSKDSAELWDYYNSDDII